MNEAVQNLRKTRYGCRSALESLVYFVHVVSLSKLARQDGVEPHSPANIKQSQDLGEIGASAPALENAERNTKIRANNTKNRAKNRAKEKPAAGSESTAG